MRTPLPRPIRAHGRALLVVVAAAAALLSLARPAGAVSAPVDPVPVGVWPLQPTPEVVRAFDPPESSWGAGHRGVDLAGSVGQVVRTALAGRVTFAARLAGRGVVVVDHGPTRTTYEPVAATVRVGDVLARGQPIGTLELAGSHCFPLVCLHWGWRRGDTYLDPHLLVRAGPIVLLPLWRSAPQVSTPVPALPPPRVRLPLPYAAVVARLEQLRRQAVFTNGGGLGPTPSL
ncbi:MAG: M23 family metallopeptidase [Nocardioides sp.]|nr:M23 family metallopeptidase [Nocardioides sp.]